MPRFKHITGLGNVQFTPEEEKARDAEEAQWKKEQEEYAKVKYKDDRKMAYDPIPEQLDQIYHDMDAWKARIKAVKDKYPKP
tara:strand:+ start:2672 stop:2917 length:246 start_codon:yes stop_codon:yes gene_type:complete